MPNNLAATNFDKHFKNFCAIIDKGRKTLVEIAKSLGEYIVVVEQDGTLRANYGDQVLKKFSEKLTKKYGKGYSVDNLELMRKFYQTHKNSETSRKLNWSQLVPLLSVEDNRKRARLEARAQRLKLTSREIRKIVKKSKNNSKNSNAKNPSILKLPTNLCLNTFKKCADSKLEIPENQMLIDCGFYVYQFVDKNTDGNNIFTDKPAFTYKAVVDNVVDGDTIVVMVDVGFGTSVRERLRFRGVDCPELKTPEGEKAKKFVTSLLKPGKQIIIRTYKNDIYGRFVVDLFYLKKANAPDDEIIKDGIFLNQELISLGLASRLEM